MLSIMSHGADTVRLLHEFYFEENVDAVVTKCTSNMSRLEAEKNQKKKQVDARTNAAWYHSPRTVCALFVVGHLQS